MLSFQVPVLGSLFVSFRPTLIRFPQLFLRCLPYALLRFLRFAFGIFPSFLLSFVRFFSGSDYSAFVFSFPFFPVFPFPGPPGAYFPFLFPPVSMRSVPLPVLSFPAFLFSAFLFRNTGATSVANLLFPVRLFPLAFALGSGYSAWVIHPEN